MQQKGSLLPRLRLLAPLVLLLGVTRAADVSHNDQPLPKSPLQYHIQTLTDSASAILNQGDVEQKKSSRILQMVPTGLLPFGVGRKGPYLVFRNDLRLREQDLANAVVGRINPNDATGATDLPLYLYDSITFGNTPDWIVVKLKEEVNIENEKVFVQFYSSGDKTDPISPPIRSTERVYQYYSSGASGALTVGVVIAIIYMALSCCCWILGVKQFYHLIKIAQMLYMVNLIASTPKSHLIYSYLEGFRYNIFNIVPNPVKILEREGVECQPAVEFFSEDLSCHSYNTLRNYVLGFLIYLVLYCFIKVNKFHEINYWNNLKDAFKFKVFMLTILPDVMIAIFLNAVGGPYNSVMSAGFLFCLVLLLWYGYIFSSIIVMWANRSEELISFLGHYTFSRSNLYITDSKLGLKVIAVLLENLKVIILTLMIALFNNAPKTQMVIVFIVYILYALFLFIFRPYNGISQNVIFGLSDICFFILLVMIYAGDTKFFETSTSFKEDGLGAGEVLMYFLILLLNLIVFFLPVLKGQDAREVKPQNSESITIQEDDEVNGKKSGQATPTHPKFRTVEEEKKESKIPKGKSSDQNDNIQRSPSGKGPARDIHTADGQKSSLFLTRTQPEHPGYS